MLAIPSLLSGNDMLVKSPVKSGKTLAYLLPLIIHCINMVQCSMLNKNFGPYAIILTPSKELCIQIETFCKKLLMGIPYMKTALLIGGVPYPNQLYRLRSGVQIIIATPKMNSKTKNKKKSSSSSSSSSSINYLSWDLISYIVIDEIDQMINCGEEETLHNILDRLRSVNPSIPLQQQQQQQQQQNNQKNSYPISHLPSTLPLSSSFVNRPIPQSTYMKPMKPMKSIKPVKQTFLWVEDNSKKKELFKLLMDTRYFQPLIIIFVDSRLGAELLTKAIEKKTGMKVACIHGQKSVEERKKILNQFKIGGPYPIIVSTSGILGRGIQIEDVHMVIQFDCASTVEDYIHQVGRCATPIISSTSTSTTTSTSTSPSTSLSSTSLSTPSNRKIVSYYIPKNNRKHFRMGHSWLGGQGGWSITFINKSNQSIFSKLYHQYLKNLSSSEL
ncbi:P-loop containing nucleoside triphosphate hydrolase protein, partial [Anaeromyces robustus]